MLNITLAQMQSDIAANLRGTSIKEIKDFFGTAAAAANRMVSRIDTQETIRTVTLATPFYDNVNDYALATDYKGMIDIRPQANRVNTPGDSNYTQTSARQFLERLSPNSFSIRWNNMVRTLRAQVLPQGNVSTLDEFDGPTSNGLWTAEGDASGLYTEILNYISGNSSLGLNLSGVTGAGDIVNTTATVVDLTALNNEDASMIYFWIPQGNAARFTSFELRRGDSALAYSYQTVTTKADGTAFSDGWNFLLFNWATANKVGIPTNKTNTYRRFAMNYSVGAAINGCLIDAWTNALGSLYEMEYYSEYMFRTATGTWTQLPTQNSDLINVGPNSYEILKAEMMIDVTTQLRTGNVMTEQLAEWRLRLNGQPQSRYVKDPPFHGLYADYLMKFPSSQIPTVTSMYEFDV